MEEDTVTLTTPVSKGNSLLKMLKKQLTREAKAESRSSSNGQSSEGHRTQPTTSPVHAVSALSKPPPPSATSSRLRDSSRPSSSSDHRHVTFRGAPSVTSAIELPEVRQREGRSHDKEEGSAQREMPKLNPHYGHVPPAPKAQAGARVNVNKTTGWRDYGATSASDTDDSPSPSHKRRDEMPKDVSKEQNTATEAISARRSQNVHNPRAARSVQQQANDPWTIHEDTYFVYGPTFRAQRATRRADKKSFGEWWAEMWSPYGGFRRLSSVWINVALLLLFVANCLYMVAFVTNNWGILHIAQENQNDVAGAGNLESPQVTTLVPAVVNNDTSLLRWIRDTWDGVSDRFSRDLGRSDGAEAQSQSESAGNSMDGGEHVVNLMKRTHTKPLEFWSFGLWQCCRNTDGLCLGIRFTEFYSATRTFSVLSLFGLILSFAWMLGHSLEKLLDYDVCTMSCLISLCYATTLFTTLAVACFGSRWPVLFEHEFDGSSPHLSYSFYLALCTIPLTLTAAVCTTVDLIKVRQREKSFYTDAELSFMDRAEEQIPTDNISRSRVHKKKRRTNQNLRYTATESTA